MCGIIGYSGYRNAIEVLSSGLKKLEYRGYDSYGFALARKQEKLKILTAVGQIGTAEFNLDIDLNSSSHGLGHTRWATHGGVTEANAHPHRDCEERIAVVHNGIISNYQEIKEKLIAKGHLFTSQTDTEIIPHLIEDYKNNGHSFLEATRLAILELEGEYAMAAISADKPGQIVFAKNKSPLLVGIGENENYVGSAEIAFLDYTRKMIPLEDMTFGVVNENEVTIYDVATGEPVEFEVVVSEWTVDQAKKGGYPHFMLKEIHEQPQVLRKTLEFLDGEEVNNLIDQVKNARNIYITAAGTSCHAAMVGEMLIEKLARVKSRTLLPSELEQKIIEPGDLCLAISQSGETADTIAVIEHARKYSSSVVSIVNNVGTQIPRLSDHTLYTKAGPEIGVAATKTFACQVIAFTRLAIDLARELERITEEEYASLDGELKRLPDLVQEVITKNEYKCKKLAKKIMYEKSAYFLGTATSLAVAREGALKLKEISYIHAEAYNAAESKHGPIALVSEKFPVIFVAGNDKTNKHLLGNIREMNARGAYCILIHDGDTRLEKVADYEFRLPKIQNAELYPVMAATILQMVAYYASAGKIMDGEAIDPDKPRNLAKSVTVR
ncbi:MAG: glutamine--fructose-6-phosphate transaminase (isomerizing) [Candidatus Hodarchaeales archaeon]